MKKKSNLKTAGKYLASTYRELFESFKNLDKKFFVISLYDALFIASALFIFMLGSSLLGKAISKLMPLASDPFGIAGTQVSLLFKAIAVLAIWAVAVFVAIVIAQTIFKGLIWTTIMGKKFTSRYFKKLFWVNVSWFLLWLVTSLIIYYGASVKYRIYVQGIYYLLLFYFTTILYILFTRKNVIKRTISKALSLGVRKVRYFIIPYIYAVIIFVIISQLFRVINPATKLGMFIGVILTIFFIAWMRLYIYSIAKDVLE
jgi:hypothetical protein